MGSPDSGSMVGIRLSWITALLVGMLAGQAGAQFHGDYRPLPAPLETAIDSADVELIVRARASAIRNDMDPGNTRDGVVGQLPATVVTIALIEVWKDQDVFKPGRSYEIRHSGFNADAQASEEVRKGSDPQWPPMEVGREYVLFVFINQSGKLHFYSPQGVFGAHEGKVLPLVRSSVGETWKGKPWERFLQAIRRHSRKRPR